MEWQVYIILCSDGSLYTGITTDLQRRFSEHAGGTGAKYFRGRKPVEIAFAEGGHTRSTASRREYFLKSLSREQKLELAKTPA